MKNNTWWSGAFTALLMLFSLIGAEAQINSGSPYSTADHEKQIIGYVPNWDAWKGQDFNIPKGAYNHYNIDYSQYTILNFSFFGVAVDGSMHSGDLRNKQIYQDGQIQQPDDLLHPDPYSSHDQAMVLGVPQEFWGWDDILYDLGYEPNPNGAYLGWVKPASGETGQWPLVEYVQPSMIKLAHDNGVKVMASIGGWSMCKHFPEMAADPIKRARFIQDCITLVEDYGFDGIDIDWEYPGPFSGMNFTGTEADYHNFTVLMQEIREAIGPDRLVTAAFSAVPSKLKDLEWEELDKVMDYYNMMSYDFHGGWSNIAGHNSPLYPYPGEEWGDFSWHTTFSYMVDSLGINSEKVNMGMAFYGRGVITESTPGVNAPTVKKQVSFSVDGPVMSAADMNNWTATEGSPYYTQIRDALAGGGWTRHWDDIAKVPYMTKSENGFHYFTSYDDEESIKLKSEYITDNNAGGVIIWEVFTDWKVGPETSKVGTYPYCPDTKPELAHVVNKVFAENAGPVNPAPVVSISAPTSVEQESLEAISFSATITDDVAIANVTISVNGTAVTPSVSGDVYSATFTPSAYGEQAIEVTATDDQGKSTTRTAKVNVIDPTVPNVAPTVSITAPADQAVITQESLGAISISVDANDTDGTIDTVRIEVNGQVFEGSTASWTPSTFGAYTISAYVVDNEGASAMATISVTVEEEVVVVQPGCDAPAYEGYPSIYNSGDVVSYNGSLYEAQVNNLYNVTPGTADHWWKPLGPCEDDGTIDPVAPSVSLTSPATGSVEVETLPYSITLASEATDTDGTIASVVYTVNGTEVPEGSYEITSYGAYNIEVTATDSDGLTATDAATITVTAPQAGTPPTVSLTSPATGSMEVSSLPYTLTLDASATDTDGSITSITYTVNGVDATDGDYTAAAYGDYVIVVTATDNDGMTATDQATVTLTEPVQTGGCDAPEYEGYPTIYNSGDQVSYNGMLYEAQVNNLYNVTPGAADHWWKPLGPCQSGPVGPTVSLTSPAEGTVETANLPYTLSLAATASDSDGTVTSLTYTVNGVDAAAGDFQADTYGDYVVIATATDNDGMTATDQVTVTLLAPQPKAPTVTLSTSVSGTVNVESLPYTFSIGATANDEDGTIASITYTVNGESATEGDYTATAFGNYVIVVTATDNDGLTATDQASVTVAEQGSTVECPYADWDSSLDYTQGTKVNYNGDIYQAKWYANKGVLPTAGDPWESTGEVCGKGGLGDEVPVITFLQPSGDTYTALTTVQVEVSATDENGTVSDVNITVDGQTSNGNLVNFTPAAYGSYLVAVSATDAQGNTVTANKTLLFTQSSVNDINPDGSINLTGPFAPAPTGAQRIVGYVPTWKGSPGDLDYSKVTHVNVAFLMYEMKAGAAYTDADFATGNYDPKELHLLDSLLPIIEAKAHAQGATVSIAVGGAIDYGFLKLMEQYRDNPAMIDVLADDLIDFVDQYNLDGIDLDLECWWQDPAIPGTAEQGGRKRGIDKWNENVDQGAHPAAYGMTLLAKKLRAKRPDLLLSAALFATPWYGNNYDADVAAYLDYIGLMTYDFTGSWDDSPIGPHASLYTVDNSLYDKASADNPIYSSEVALEYWSGDWATWQGSGHGVAKNKLAIGVPFYGYDLSLSKKDAGQGTNGFYFIGYDEILSLYPDAATSYDPNDPNQLNGFVGAEDGRKIYYETPKGAAAKVTYAKNNGLQGTIIWELTFDVTDPSKSLLTAMNNALYGSARFAEQQIVSPQLDVKFYPNPFSEQTQVQLNLSQQTEVSVVLYNLQGSIVKRIQKSLDKGMQSIAIDGSKLSSGVYLMSVQAGNSRQVQKLIKQ
ncbi:glycosyl hydrolase family 18 protein [Algivirga pacifica]